MPRNSQKRISNVLKFWRDLEFFHPFQLSDVFDLYPKVFPISRHADSPLPWEDPKFYELDPEREYAYDIFVAPFLLEEVLEVLTRLVPEIGAEVLPDPRRFEGLSCFLRMSAGSKGEVRAKHVKVSTSPWALACYSSTPNLQMQKFDLFATEIVRDIENLSANLEDEGTPRPLTRAALAGFVDSLATGHPLTFYPNDLLCVVVPYLLPRSKAPLEDTQPLPVAEGDADEAEEPGRASAPDPVIRRKVDILNSFYLRDLERIHAHCEKEGLPPALTHYFTHRPAADRRIDTLVEESRDEMLRHLPKQESPAGRWLSPKEHQAGFQQQLALNRYLNDKESLYAVNGPPGTGKTTLIRELLARLMVERAILLSRIQKPADALEETASTGTIGSRAVRFRRLKEQFSGFELVVASSNNAAVENISLELPDLKSLAPEFSGLRYLESLARLFTSIRFAEKKRTSDETAPAQFWGMPSVPLGNRTNLSRFRRAAFRFSWQEPENEQSERIRSGRLTLFEWRHKAEPGSLSFGEAQRRFVEVSERCQKWFSEQAPMPQKRSAAASLRSAEWQLSTPGASEEGNLLQSELCAAAFLLQEAWLRHVPRFEQELTALSYLLQRPQDCDSASAKALWQLMFMIIPCISTTLASVERMLGPVPPATFGNLVLDEAGQATPQSAAGAIWRAKRVLVLGDQRQLEPIVIIPAGLERRLADSIDEETRIEFSPLSSSVQSIADKSEKFGTWLYACDGHKEIWLGQPLLVHRRCSSPMFEISNSIAYNNIMLQGGSSVSWSHDALGWSGWFDVKGKTTEKQWVPEQGRVAVDLIFQLLNSNTSPADIFCITPFREVKEQLKKMLRKAAGDANLPREVTSRLLRQIGTVHAFQGKEALVVIFVLGCDLETEGAADWAGERPNLVNVAVTRARRYLYVLGDIDVWHNRGYFSDLEKNLPRRTIT